MRSIRRCRRSILLQLNARADFRRYSPLAGIWHLGGSSAIRKTIGAGAMCGFGSEPMFQKYSLLDRAGSTDELRLPRSRSVVPKL
jgi:hypothetical protein